MGAEMADWTKIMPSHLMFIPDPSNSESQLGWARSMSWKPASERKSARTYKFLVQKKKKKVASSKVPELKLRDTWYHHLPYSQSGLILQQPSICATIPTPLPKAPKIGPTSQLKLAIPNASAKMSVKVQSAVGGLYAMLYAKIISKL
jgi:hypothetical protein